MPASYWIEYNLATNQNLTRIIHGKFSAYKYRIEIHINARSSYLSDIFFLSCSLLILLASCRVLHSLALSLTLSLTPTAIELLKRCNSILLCTSLITVISLCLCVSVAVLSWYWFIRIYGFIYEHRLEIQLVASAIVSIILFCHTHNINRSIYLSTPHNTRWYYEHCERFITTLSHIYERKRASHWCQAMVAFSICIMPNTIYRVSLFIWPMAAKESVYMREFI